MARSTGQRLLGFDRKLDVRFVAGADEAGRGSLAGPLVVAGVLFDYGTLRGSRVRRLATLNDSKQVSVSEREALFEAVGACASAISVRVVPVASDRPQRAASLEPRRSARRARRPSSARRGLPRRRVPARADGTPAPGRRRRRRTECSDRRGLDRREGRPRSGHAASGCALSELRLRLARRLHHAGAQSGSPLRSGRPSSTAAPSRPPATSERREPRRAPSPSVTTGSVATACSRLTREPAATSSISFCDAVTASVVVEVKEKSGSAFGHPLEMIDEEKVRRVYVAAGSGSRPTRSSTGWNVVFEAAAVRGRHVERVPLA